MVEETGRNCDVPFLEGFSYPNRPSAVLRSMRRSRSARLPAPIARRIIESLQGNYNPAPVHVAPPQTD